MNKPDRVVCVRDAAKRLATSDTGETREQQGRTPVGHLRHQSLVDYPLSVNRRRPLPLSASAVRVPMCDCTALCNYDFIYLAYL